MLQKIRKNLSIVVVALVMGVMTGMSAMAAGPAVRLTDFRMTRDNYSEWVSAEFYCRNNSGKTIKYITWNITARNRVGDVIADNLTGRASAELTTIGPIEPFSVSVNPNGQFFTAAGAQGTPFSEYRESGYWINDGEDQLMVYLDRYNNFFAVPSGGSITDAVYLTDDEINNAMYDGYTIFNNVFYQSLIDHLYIEDAVVTYMDGTTQVISGADLTSGRYARLQNAPFLATVQRYSAVYNYEDYKALNPDLVQALGDNPKLLFEHFINSGMKEGRQASYAFNVGAYKDNNPDLVAAFGSDNVKYYEHYISSGKAEGRKAV